MGPHYNLGVVYGYLDSTRLARSAFASALRADSTYAPAHKKLGHFHLRDGELEIAAASFRRAVAHAPEDAEAHFNLGVAYRNLGDLENAVSSMEKATRLNPVDHKMRLNLGNLYMRTGRGEEGRRLLESARRQLGRLSELHAEIRPPSQGEAVRVGSARDHYHSGLSYVLEGKSREAVREFRRSIAIAPDRKDPHTGLGMLLLEAGNTDEALFHLERAVEIDGEDAFAWTRLGWGYRKLERLPEARAAFETAARLDTGLAEAALNLGHVLFRMGNVEESVDQLSQGHPPEPERPGRPCQPRGRPGPSGRTGQGGGGLPPRPRAGTGQRKGAARPRGRVAPARGRNRRVMAGPVLLAVILLLSCPGTRGAAESAPAGAGGPAVIPAPADSAALHLARGRRHLKARDLALAIAELGKATRLAPESAEAHDLLGLAYSFRLQTGKAIEQIERAIALDPGNGSYYLHLGKQHMLLMDHGAAEAAYLRAMELGLKKEKPFYDLGIISEGRNRLAEARVFFEKAVAALPGFAPGYLRLGMILEREGNEKRALEQYAAALERDPGLAAAHYRIALLYLREGREVLAQIHLERFRALKKSQGQP